MTETTLLQILLFIQAFVLGTLVTLAIQYYRRHYVASLHEAELIEHMKPEEVLSPEVKQRLVDESELKIQAALNSTASKLHYDLDASSIEINQSVKRLANDIVSGEMERYRHQLGQLHDQADKQMGAIREEVSKHEQEIKAKVAAELSAEKQRLVQQIDTKLADAVGSFLNETLRHNVDLGGQTQYLLSLLEEHKADFIKQVGQDELELQNNLVSRQDLRAVILEIKKLSQWFGQSVVKQKVAGQEFAGQPPLSAASADLLNRWHAQQPVSQKSLDDLLAVLEELEAKAAYASVTLAAPASAELRRQIAEWFRKNVRPDLLIDFSFDATMLGGMMVRYNSRTYDWSFKRSILANRAKFPEILRNV